MRTYEDCFRDYCKWLVSKTGNIGYSYDNLLKNEEPDTVKSFLYKSILNLCYDAKDGLYYFCKFVVGDLLDIGYPQALRYNKLLREWDGLARKYNELAILCGRGHGKSVFFTQILNIYDMLERKEIRGYTWVSKTEWHKLAIS